MHPPDDDMQASSQALLDRDVPPGRWPTETATAFDRSLAERQLRDNRYLLRLGIGVLLVSTPFDFIFIPDHALLMLAMRLGLVLPLQLVGLLAPLRYLALQKAVTGLSLVAFCAVLLVGAQWAPPILGAYMAIAPILLLGMTTPVLAWSPREVGMLLLVFATVAVATMVLAGGPVLRNPAYIVIAIATGVVAYFLQKRMRALLGRNFLLTAQAELRLADLARGNARLVELSMQDPLTGLANRRRTIEAFALQYDTAPARGEARVAVMMIDLDRFKHFNDSWGHHAGDDCLRAVAEEMRHCADAHGGIAARFGGEEFVLVMRVDGERQARQIAEDLRMAIERIEIPHESSQGTATCTASIGIALHSGEGVPELEELMKRADTALYAAKDRGRNRSEMAD